MIRAFGRRAIGADPRSARNRSGGGRRKKAYRRNGDGQRRIRFTPPPTHGPRDTTRRRWRPSFGHHEKGRFDAVEPPTAHLGSFYPAKRASALSSWVSRAASARRLRWGGGAYSEYSTARAQRLVGETRSPGRAGRRRSRIVGPPRIATRPNVGHRRRAGEWAHDWRHGEMVEVTRGRAQKNSRLST